MTVIYNNKQENIEVRELFKGEVYELINPFGANHICQGKNKLDSQQLLLKTIEIFISKRIMNKVSNILQTI